MKTPGFILVACLLISISISAQTNLELNPNSIQTGNNLLHKMLNDTLKLESPFNENKLQIPFDKYNFSQQGPNLAQNYQFEQVYAPMHKMPIARPDINSKMPIAKPDSSVHYFLLIKKIGK
jgi:hypothetical protein